MSVRFDPRRRWKKRCAAEFIAEEAAVDGALEYSP